jgi:riboflavin synthase
MFTGLVEEIGLCEDLQRSAGSARLLIQAPGISCGVKIGDSISVNGCCLTAISIRDGIMTFDLLDETLQRTNLQDLIPGKKVNLERSLLADGRLGGHFVQGHVDATIPVVAILQQGSDLRINFKVPPEFAAYVAYKGSVAINGVSLTIAEVTADSFAVWIIPHTASHTNLGDLREGDLVNLECDMLAKYAARIMQMRGL